MSIKYLALALLVAVNCSANEGPNTTKKNKASEKYQGYRKRLEADKEARRQQEEERLAKLEEEAEETSEEEMPETPEEVLMTFGNQSRAYENERLAGGVAGTVVGGAVFYSLCNDVDPSMTKMVIKITAAGVLMGIGSVETYLRLRDKRAKNKQAE